MAKTYDVTNAVGAVNRLTVNDDVVPQIDKKEKILVLGQSVFRDWVSIVHVPPAEVPGINLLVR